MVNPGFPIWMYLELLQARNGLDPNCAVAPVRFRELVPGRADESNRTCQANKKNDD